MGHDERMSAPAFPSIKGGERDSANQQAGPVSLWAWYRPYLRGSQLLLLGTLAATAVVLICQAVIPLQVDALLHAGEVNSTAAIALILLVLTQIGFGYVSHLGAHDVAHDSALRLRLAVYDSLIQARSLRQDGLVRSSVVSRHTSDVDNVSEAFERTIAEGLPGIIRVAQSLILLTWLDWRAGLVMAVATAAFLLISRHVGSGLLALDKARLDASSRVGETVDESITASRLIAGLHLEPWVTSRFAVRARTLRSADHGQSHKVTQLAMGAWAAGLAGLVAVVVFGLSIGGMAITSVAAALLYVEGIVRGLEALPGWLRAVNLAAVSRRRIDQILEADHVPNAAQPHPASPIAEGSLPPGHLIGLVTDTGTDPDQVLAAISTGGHPDPWRVSLEGLEIRRPDVGSELAHVPADTTAFNASVREHLTSTRELSDGDILHLLDSVGLGHVAQSTIGLDARLGPVGARLGAHERQRLALGAALAQEPEVLLVGPLIPLSDVDTALPLLDALRESPGTAIVAVVSPDVAATMDAMVFAHDGALITGAHEDLLVESPAYARLWERRLNPDHVDLSVLGLEDDDQARLHSRLVTERYAPGEVIYRQGDIADRIIFVISGKVEISTADDFGTSRRVAVLSAGNHCGDLRLTVGEKRAETATAVDMCVVRSLSREAVSAGMTGLLDRTPVERRVVASLLKAGPASRADLSSRLPDIDSTAMSTAVAVLLHDGAVRESDDVLSVVSTRKARSSRADLWDRLG